MSAFTQVFGRGDFAAALSDAGDKLVIVYFTDNQTILEDGSKAELEPLEAVAGEYGEEMVYLVVSVTSAEDTDEYSFPAVFYNELPCAVLYKEGSKLGQVIGPTEDSLKRKIELVKSGDEEDEAQQGDVQANNGEEANDDADEAPAEEGEQAEEGDGDQEEKEEEAKEDGDGQDDGPNEDNPEEEAPDGDSGDAQEATEAEEGDDAEEKGTDEAPEETSTDKDSEEAVAGEGGDQSDVKDKAEAPSPED